jgi:hypothetical protein
VDRRLCAGLEGFHDCDILAVDSDEQLQRGPQVILVAVNRD